MFARVSKKFDDCDPLVMLYVTEYLTRKRLMQLGFRQDVTKVDEIDIEIFGLIDDEYQELAKNQIANATAGF